MLINSLMITEIQAKLENIQPIESIPVKAKQGSYEIGFADLLSKKNGKPPLRVYQSTNFTWLGMRSLQINQ